ncbi:MAG: hypothetical protein ACYDCN_11175 [Bacteroidia bacterium]
MNDKKTYFIDDGALRQKLLSYSVSFNPEAVAALENEISHIKTHASFELLERKTLVKFVALPLIVMSFVVVAYFGFNYIIDISKNNSTKKDSTTVVKPTVEPKPEVKQEEIKTPTVTTVSITPEVNVYEIADELLKKDIQEVKTKTKTDPQSEKVIVHKKDTGATSTTKESVVKTDTLKKGVATTDSSDRKKDTPVKKKKKKKNTDVTEDIRQQNQQPNATDDDVVVPPGN